jgi:hypothetical protein
MSLFYPSREDDYDEICTLRADLNELRTKYNKLLTMTKFIEQQNFLQKVELEKLRQLVKDYEDNLYGTS